ncbi:transposable element Tc3 transposase [Trichonephila clavipes]|nr:transposable element Tc3 transposase [Trichonephila clavipes]
MTETLPHLICKTIFAIANLKRKRKRVQSKTGEVLTKENILESLAAEESDLKKKFHVVNIKVVKHTENFKFGLAIHQNDHQARRIFVEWAQNKIAVVPDFHKRILFSDEAHLWLNGYANKQICRIWSEANPQVYVKTPLHPEKLTVWCTLWAGGILLQKR